MSLRESVSPHSLPEAASEGKLWPLAKASPRGNLTLSALAQRQGRGGLSDRSQTASSRLASEGARAGVGGPGPGPTSASC